MLRLAEKTAEKFGKDNLAKKYLFSQVKFGENFLLCLGNLAKWFLLYI